MVCCWDFFVSVTRNVSLWTREGDETREEEEEDKAR